MIAKIPKEGELRNVKIAEEYQYSPCQEKSSAELL